jgi:hypothetical protein
VGYSPAARSELDLWYPFSSPWLTSGLADDDILKALGSQNEFTGEQRVKFIDGLRDALGAIRVKKIRDFDNIAKEIIAHRRTFLGDDSKVLPLEGTII